MRGTRKERARGRDRNGIIPALAGNTICTTMCAYTRWDHPRACGEHISSPCSLASFTGSSPRLRGTRIACRWLGSWRGIIPALAGNTRTRSMWSAASGDHPRACGEHRSVAYAAYSIPGSSPRLRGTRERVQLRLCFVGIIPALAGNTLNTSLRVRLRRDHPRACGEHSRFHFTCLRIRGSSPRLRGTLNRRDKAAMDYGIIPALAGNTASCSTRARSPRDHPRACGEH